MEMDGRNVRSEIEDQSLIVDIIDMEDKLERVLDISEDCCIYRVPKHLRDTNEAAYVPQLVSLGPFHHGNPNLKAMEEHKLRCFKSFIKEHQIDLDALLMLVKGHEEKTREYYADHIALPSKQFVQVILVDAIFVINFLLECNCYSSAIPVRSIYHKVFFRGLVIRDMMLLENQLPLFILKEILNFVEGTKDTRIIELSEGLFTWLMKEEDSATKLSNCFSNCHMKEEGSVTKLSNCLFNCHKKEGTYNKSDNKDLNSYNNARHFIDFQRLFYMPVEAMEEDRCDKKLKKIKSMSKLHKVGVRFKAVSGKTLLDIKFKDGVLYIPGIVVADPTETFFRNLLAYDQCHNGPSRISDYFALMGMLIDTADDVELLVKNNILQNDLDTDQEVSKLFNNLEKEVFFQVPFSYSPLCNEINKYCEIPRHKWMSTLKQNYLDTPWKVISLIAAFILLVLTMIQNSVFRHLTVASVVYLCNISLGEYLAALRKLPLITK